MSITEGILEGVAKLFGKVFGTANERELKSLWPLIEKVNEHWAEIRKLSDQELSEKTNEFRRRP